MRRRAGLLAATLLLSTMATSTAARAAAQPVNVFGQGLDGETIGAGVDCPNGPLDDARRWIASAPVAPGTFTPGAASMRLELEVLTGTDAAALRGADSFVVLRDDVGSVTLALSSGSCEVPSLDFDGTTVAGSGTWQVVPDESPSNAYRDAVGNGSFALRAEVVTDGRDGVWELALNGWLDGASCTVDARGASAGAPLAGGDGPDKICGSPFADTIEGLGGDDEIYAGSGADNVRGNAGNDWIAGGPDDDTILARPGIDGADGGDGFDRCVARSTSNCETGPPG